MKYVEARLFTEVTQTPPYKLLQAIQPGSKIKVATHNQIQWLTVTHVSDFIYCGEYKIERSQVLDVLITG